MALENKGPRQTPVDEPATTTARIPVSLDDELLEVIRQRPRGQKPSKGELLAKAWEKAKSIPISDESRVAQNRAAEPSLTEEQRDILAMLGEDPDKDFLFSSIQTTVAHALEQYRRKWKPQTKAADQGETGRSHRRPTGTR